MYGHFPVGSLQGLLIIIVLGIVVYRLMKGQPEKNSEKTPRDILDERYAKGEIDAEEYQERKNNLKD
jgi:putative membrane protein